MNDATAFTDAQARKKKAQQGKSAEKQVKDYLLRCQTRLGAGFDYERNPDARSAGGAFQVRTGDFYAYYKKPGFKHGVCINIEVKETIVPARLPGKNFSRDAIARCYKRSLAGVLTIILVHHSTTGRWVLMPIKHLFETVAPSWTTADFPSFDSCEEALDSALREVF